MTERKNCIAIDGSKQSEHAFNWYVENYHRSEDTALLVHVQETPNRSIETFVEGKANRYESVYKRLSTSEKVLEKFKAKCVLKNIKFTPYLAPQKNSIGHTICRIAENNNACVIVTGQRGIGKISRTLLGTTSDYIMHNTQIPVLIVPFKKDKKKSKKKEKSSKQNEQQSKKEEQQSKKEEQQSKKEEQQSKKEEQQLTKEEQQSKKEEKQSKKEEQKSKKEEQKSNKEEKQSKKEEQT